MRKLEDGTYMYDTDSPWDAVWAQLLYCLAYLAFLAFVSWKFWSLIAEDGLATELDFHDILLLVHILLLFWGFPRLIRGLRNFIRVARS